MITSLDIEDDLVVMIDECVMMGRQAASQQIPINIPLEYLSLKGRKVLEEFKRNKANLFAGENRTSVVMSIMNHYLADDRYLQLFKEELQARPTIEINKPLTYSEQQQTSAPRKLATVAHPDPA